MTHIIPFESAVEIDSDRQRPIPVVFNIDIEPDRFQTDLSRRERWTGYEQSADTVARWRERMHRITGRAPHFTWLLRLDQQIADTYGSGGWPLEEYAARLDADRDAGDELGVHVHPFRWLKESHEWLEDYQNTSWVEECVQNVLEEFRCVRGEAARSFSFGNHWTSTRAMNLLEQLGVRHDLSIVPGSKRRLMNSSPVTKAVGVQPDYRDVPTQPWQPSSTDFRKPQSPVQPGGIWALPLSNIVPGPRQRLRRMIHSMAGRKVPTSHKYLLREGPAQFGPTFDHVVRARDQPFFLFAIRSSIFINPRAFEALQNSVDFLLSHPQAHRLLFATPAESIELLHGADGARHHEGTIFRRAA